MQFELDMCMHFHFEWQCAGATSHYVEWYLIFENCCHSCLPKLWEAKFFCLHFYVHKIMWYIVVYIKLCGHRCTAVKFPTKSMPFLWNLNFHDSLFEQRKMVTIWCYLYYTEREESSYLNVNTIWNCFVSVFLCRVSSVHMRGNPMYPHCFMCHDLSFYCNEILTAQVETLIISFIKSCLSLNSIWTLNTVSKFFG